MPAKAPLPPPEDELEAAMAMVLATVVLADDEEEAVVVVVRLAAVELTRSVVVELAAVEEEAIASTDFDVVAKRQIPRAALPPHICKQTLEYRSGKRSLEAVGKTREERIPTYRVGVPGARKAARRIRQDVRRRRDIRRRHEALAVCVCEMAYLTPWVSAGGRVPEKQLPN